MTEHERLKKLNRMLESSERFYKGEDVPHFLIKPEMFKPVTEQDAPAQELTDPGINPCQDAGGAQQPQIKAVEVIAAISILADRGSHKLFKRSLASLKEDSGVIIGLHELCSLAFAGCANDDDIALVRCLSEPLKAESNAAQLSGHNDGEQLSPGIAPEKIAATPDVKKGFEVFVDDNFHFMQEDERYSAGTFDTYEEAVAKAKSIVDSFLESHYKEGMTAEELCRGYKGYGEDPFIVGDFNQEYEDEFLAHANAIMEQMGARLKDHEGEFEAMNKPLDLPESKVRFSAWEYAEKRCEEICRANNITSSDTTSLKADSSEEHYISLHKNPIGSSGRKNMCNKYIKMAEEAIEREDWKTAHEMLNIAVRIADNSHRI